MQKALNHTAAPAPLFLPEFGSFVPRMRVDRQRRFEPVLFCIVAFALGAAVACLV